MIVGHLDIRLDRLAASARGELHCGHAPQSSVSGREEPERFHPQRHEQRCLCPVFVCASHAPGDDLEACVEKRRMKAVLQQFTAEGYGGFNQSQCFAGMAPDLLDSAKTGAKIQSPPFIVCIESFGSNFFGIALQRLEIDLDRVDPKR